MQKQYQATLSRDPSFDEPDGSEATVENEPVVFGLSTEPSKPPELAEQSEPSEPSDSPEQGFQLSAQPPAARPSDETLTTIGRILKRKTSVAQMMSKTAEGLAHSFQFRRTSPEDLVFELFKLSQKDEASIGRLISVLKSFGLKEDDPRLRPTMEKIREFDLMNDNDDNDVRHYRLNRQQFRECVHPCIGLISQALRNQLIIPNWGEFTAKIREIFEQCSVACGGQVATYIPQLARQDPNQWGAAICTIDGQRFALGASKHPFCVQSVSKAFNYAIVASDLGADYVHSFVGHEPSGRLFNEICLDANGKPHNPLINAGAIIVTSLLKKGLAMADRYDFAFNEYRKLAGGGYVGFNNATFLSERYSADRNYALSYYMKENKCFPADIQSLREELEFYFQLCSLETHCESAAVMAATLANGGVCPLTNERCIEPRPCRDVLSLMYSCGMYDYSGQFAFHVGLPAKSGVSGAMVVVVPNLMGMCLWSPPLDKMGNSTRGVLFCQKLIETFNFHNYDSLLHADSKKIDPRRRVGNKETDIVVSLLFSCKNGDLETIRRLYLQGVNMNIADYDGRTALHLAACEGHTIIVKFLLNVVKVNFRIRDRWGRSALDDARTFNHKHCVDLLLKAEKRLHYSDSAGVLENAGAQSPCGNLKAAGAQQFSANAKVRELRNSAFTCSTDYDGGIGESTAFASGGELTEIDGLSFDHDDIKKNKGEDVVEDSGDEEEEEGSATYGIMIMGKNGRICDNLADEEKALKGSLDRLSPQDFSQLNSQNDSLSMNHKSHSNHNGHNNDNQINGVHVNIDRFK